MARTHPLIDQLARGHDSHLHWLSGRLSQTVVVEELEAILDVTYERALDALLSASDSAASHLDDDKARAWLRSIALNVADERRRAGHRALPARRARGGAGRISTSATSHGGEATVANAVATLTAEHRQSLKLRHGDGHEPAEIMFLSGLSRSQWDARHAGAVKGLVRALTKGSAAVCPQYAALAHTGGDWSDPDSAYAGHRDSCRACRRLGGTLQGVLSAMPMPLPIAAWKFDALKYFTPEPSQGAHAATASGASGGKVAGSLKGLVAGKAAVTAATGVVAVGALAGATAMLGASTPAPPAPDRATPATERTRDARPARLANHATQRQALERAARRQARRRAQARRQQQEPSTSSSGIR